MAPVVLRGRHAGSLDHKAHGGSSGHLPARSHASHARRCSLSYVQAIPCVIVPASPMKEEGPLEGRQSPPWGEKSVNSLAGSRRVAFLGWGALETPQWGCSKMTPERPVSVWLHQGRPPLVNPERSEWGVQESRHAVDGVFDQTARPSHPWGLGWEGPCSWLSGPTKDVSPPLNPENGTLLGNRVFAGVME